MEVKQGGRQLYIGTEFPVTAYFPHFIKCDSLRRGSLVLMAALKRKNAPDHLNRAQPKQGAEHKDETP
jgi:hypothetical protein